MEAILTLGYDPAKAKLRNAKMLNPVCYMGA